MASTPVAQSLVGIFVNEQLLGKKAKSWEKKADKKIERAAVLGAGIMGGGIAYQSALKGTAIKMKDIAQQENRTILFISHNMNAIKDLCTHSILLNKGMIEMMGETEEVIKKYLDGIKSTID